MVNHTEPKPQCGDKPRMLRFSCLDTLLFPQTTNYGAISAIVHNTLQKSAVLSFNTFLQF